MNYKIWDKQESINGVPAEDILNTHKNLQTGDVLLFLNDFGKVERIEDVDILRSVYNITGGDSLFVAQEYLRIVEEINTQAQQEAVTVQQLQTQLSEQNQVIDQLLVMVLEG